MEGVGADVTVLRQTCAGRARPRRGRPRARACGTCRSRAATSSTATPTTRPRAAASGRPTTSSSTTSASAATTPPAPTHPTHGTSTARASPVRRPRAVPCGSVEASLRRRPPSRTTPPPAGVAQTCSRPTSPASSTYPWAESAAAPQAAPSTSPGPAGRAHRFVVLRQHGHRWPTGRRRLALVGRRTRTGRSRGASRRGGPGTVTITDTTASANVAAFGGWGSGLLAAAGSRAAGGAFDLGGPVAVTRGDFTDNRATGDQAHRRRRPQHDLGRRDRRPPHRQRDVHHVRLVRRRVGRDRGRRWGRGARGQPRPRHRVRQPGPRHRFGRHERRGSTLRGHRLRLRRQRAQHLRAVDATVTRSSLTGNAATGAGGGALVADTATVTDSELRGNTRCCAPPGNGPIRSTTSAGAPSG